MFPITNSSLFSLQTPCEKIGGFLQSFALLWIRPIDYVVERSMHNFSTAILPGKFGNLNSALAEKALRISSCVLSILSLPLTLAFYGVGQTLDAAGNYLNPKPYYYLKGDLKEEKGLVEKKSMTIFSLNLCMLPFGIFTLGGISPPAERMDEAAKVILKADQDFVCLQEMSFGSSLLLWEKIKGSYAHGFARIGPMPSSRMEGALFFASKYPLLEVRYHKLSYTGAIVRGVFCAKTEKGWILNGHLSSGSDNAEERALQIKEIAALCEELSLEGTVPCFVSLDSNITRTGKEGDEYNFCQVSNYFTNGLKEEPFTLTAETATYTSCLTASIQGKEDPSKIDEAFECVDFTLVYKPTAFNSKVITRVEPGYDLDNRDIALSDHHVLLSQIVF